MIVCSIKGLSVYSMCAIAAPPQANGGGGGKQSPPEKEGWRGEKMWKGVSGKEGERGMRWGEDGMKEEEREKESDGKKRRGRRGRQ